MRNHTTQEFSDDLRTYEQWLIDVMLNTEFVPAMADMATQMSAIATQYTEIIGSFLDAQNQMDTQRLFKKLQFDAHKDYRPSEDFCWFGTNVRSLAASETKGQYNALALSRISLARQLGTSGVSGAASAADDHEARWQQFVKTYCETTNNNQQGAGGGLVLACDHDGSGGSTVIGAENMNRVNRDIDYTRLIEEPRTLTADFSDDTTDTSDPNITGSIKQPGDEEDILAMSKNLYGHNVLLRALSHTSLTNAGAQESYMALRSIAAKRGVAQASFNAIVALKSAGAFTDSAGGASKNESQKFLAAIVAQLLPIDAAGHDGDIFDLIGRNPSYYAQLEILAKRIYQNPDFYASLYDTPTNVARKKVAMQAVELMIDRAMYESQLRREMSVSVLLASKLRASQRRVNKGLSVSVGNK